ncbi:response regulator [Pseudobutyrivibrio sp. MD2005]|uniref:response regulator n=1 Tax=Pseudobutyrivibrio sp. MD2005 TaxID=1410616 RepID=UPI0004819503|nr:response regulator [Pseudobutyrivibrio sp. MD2005]
MRVMFVDDKKKDLDELLEVSEDLFSGAEVVSFDDPLNALAMARTSEIDIAIIDTDMCDLSGIELGGYLKELNPFINIIFTSNTTNYGFEAMQLHASGYMLKPVTKDKVRDELAQLRYAEKYNDHKRVFAQTFGNFELFVDGKPVEFKYSRTKEIVAILINNRGAQTTNGEIIASLWEDDGDPAKKQSYLSNLRQDLQNTFTKLKLEGIILKQRGSMAIAKERIECDLFDWLEKKNASKYKYLGDYMNQYSWCEFFHAELDEISYDLEE